MWFGRTVTTAGTPVPKREVEEKSRGNGPVITYRLSPEEIAERYGPPGAPVKSKRPVGLIRRTKMLSEEQRRRAMMRYAKREEEKSMSAETVAPKAPDKVEVLRRLAAGQKVSRIEDELGLSRGALHYWLGKWNLKGVKGEQAQRLLDEMLIDQRGECTAEPTATDEPELPDVPPEVEETIRNRQKNELIEQLKKELAEKTTEVERLKAANTRAVALAGQAAEKHLAEIEQLKKTVAQLEEENKYWMGQAEGLGHEVDRLREERDALLQTVERAVDTNKPVRIELMHVIESAVIGLTGIEAYCTGAAIQHLWNWKGVEDLRTARWCLDQLIREREAEAQYAQAQCAQ